MKGPVRRLLLALAITLVPLSPDVYALGLPGDVDAVAARDSVTARWGAFSSSDNKVINGAGGTEEVILTCDGDWTISISDEDASWLSVSPSSGHAGKNRIRITTARNTSGGSRTGTLTVAPHSGSNSLSVKQRAYVYDRKVVASGKVTNALTLDYSWMVFTKFYSILPVPPSCMYQDISRFTGTGKVQKSRNNGNEYLVNDLRDSAVPSSGGKVISYSCDVTTYSVSVSLSLIDDIPEPDRSSEPYRMYLGDDGEYIMPSDPDIIAVSEELWKKSGGDMMEYAKGCFGWTAQNMTYGNPYTDLHPIKELMRTRLGDCGNFSSVFISLLRARGIPARHIVMMEPGSMKKHVRAEFYVPGYGWIPADPQMENSMIATIGESSLRENWLYYHFGRFTGKYVILSFGINSQVRSPDVARYEMPLLQSYRYWYRYSTNGWHEVRHHLSDFE